MLNLRNFKYNDVYYMTAPALLPNANKYQKSAVLNTGMKVIKLADTTWSNKTTALTSHFQKYNLLNHANIVTERFKGLNNPQIYKYEFNRFLWNEIFTPIGLLESQLTGIIV